MLTAKLPASANSMMLTMALETALVCFAVLTLSSALVCPDGGMCDEISTCCKNTEGGYGCCPLPRAECCSDHLHCCYEGTLCDLTHHKCVNQSVSLPWIARRPAKQAPPTAQKLPVKAVICPDQESECPDDSTCCQLPDASWGCCPLAKAVCCQDKQHCCPEGTTCDLKHSKCVSASSAEPRPLVAKLPARRRKLPPLLDSTAALNGDVVCPDQMTVCPKETTCCQMANGTYGCCPMPDAVCCSDHVHCCPAGTQCDLEHSACVAANGTVSMLALANAKLEEPQRKGGAVACNESVSCADDSTCCKLSGGAWACCPLPEAVCCEDHLHCCPHGTVCNLAASTCDDVASGAVTPWLSKVPAFPLATVPLANASNIKCDKSTSCPGRTTCCRTVSGDWACCPLPQAVCCDDHIHCCPHNTVCNLEAQTCDDPSGSAPSRRWLTKMAAVTVSTATSESVDEKCDKETMCPGGTTCCKKDSGLWACCPLPQAVCCNDHEHCCPNGYKCNVAEQTCDKPDAPSRPWLKKTSVLQRDASVSAFRPIRIMCDARTSCPRDATCCFMEQSQEWGCCPLPDAVCCDGGTHCCPRGNACQPHRSSCSRGPHSVPWVAKLSARTETARANDVKCDDKSSCASGATCCKLLTGEWGCCPLVKAVCCADHEHCCPQSYTCNMQTETCEKKSVLVLPQTKVAPSESPAEERVVPCGSGGEFQCGLKETCCQVSPTEWRCCPSPTAVCCPGSDGCCPSGWRCDLQSGRCSPPAGLNRDSASVHRRRPSAL